jgi:Fe-S oxidoreductase
MDKSLRYEPNRQEPKLKTFLDFSDSQGYLRAIEQCNGSGDCRKTEESHGGMCPSYHASRDEKDTTRARANALRMFITQQNELSAFAHEEVVEALDLCLSCKACASECPSNVDMATLKAEYLFQYQEKKGYSLRSRFFAYSTHLNHLASKVSGISNALFASSASYLLKALLGVAKERSLPKVYSFNYQKYYEQLTPPVTPVKEIVLYIDEFSRYLDAPLVKAAIETLNKLGYKLHLMYTESGRAFISKGFLRQAKLCAQQSIDVFKPYLDQRLEIVGLEPSAILSFRDEYARLLPEDPYIKKLATNSLLIEEFLLHELKQGRIDPSIFTKESKIIKVHVHCHQKAHSNQKVTFDLLNAVPNYQVTLMATGCCGMAGSFGYE